MAKIAQDEKITNQEFDLFEAILALDKKDYEYFEQLTSEQQKKFSPYMLLHYMSSVSGRSDIQNYCLRSTDYYANKYMFNENIQKHPKLQWLMLVASSPGLGKQFHPWIPQIKDKVVKLRDPAKLKDIKDYFSKIYPNGDKETITELSEIYVEQHKVKFYLAKKFPNLKHEDIETLSHVVTNDDIEKYEQDSGN